MEVLFSEQAYSEMIQALFQRFPSFQSNGKGAYKPGLANMEFFDQLAGHPHKSYDVIHVAGTNGKGSVSNMLASALAAAGLKVGLYTSPHISDFRERMRIVSSFEHDCSEGRSCGDLSRLISKEEVWDFVCRWRDTFDHLDMSFFEITTMMALCWFAQCKVDVVVLETGLGGRLDSTNIVSPVLSVITNIGLDHCDLLGDTLPEIAFEKAGIIKPRVPVVVGESHPETDQVFERKVLYTNLYDPFFMGNRSLVMSLLTFADKTVPSMWERQSEILSEMDLKGDYQSRNLRTVLAALDVLRGPSVSVSWKSHLSGERLTESMVKDALVHTALRVGFHGRWEKLSDNPLVICDIGHNEHGLKYNFAQLSRMREEGECDEIIIVYGSVADKDVDAALRLLPEDALVVFTKASGKRAMDPFEIKSRYMAYRTIRNTDDGGCSGRPDSIVAVGSDGGGCSGRPDSIVAVGSDGGGCSGRPDSIMAVGSDGRGCSGRPDSIVAVGSDGRGCSGRPDSIMAVGSDGRGCSGRPDSIMAVGSDGGKVFCEETVEAAVRRAMVLASDFISSSRRPLVYIGGSTYVVSEAVPLFV